MSTEETANIYNHFANQFQSHSKNVPLWHYLNDCASFHDPNGWRNSCAYLKSQKEIIVFYDPTNDRHGVKICDNSKIHRMMGETFSSVDYFTNPSRDFLLCLNDHDFVIGCGKVKQWLIDFYG